MTAYDLNTLSPSLRAAVETVIGHAATGHGFYGVADDPDMIAIDAEWAVAQNWLDPIVSSTGGDGYRLTREAKAALADEIKQAR